MIQEILNIQYPVIQGGMAWISDASLAAAVSNAGGLGVIACGNAPGTYVREQIEKIRELTDKPYGLNVMLLSPYVEEVALIATEEKVPVVITGAGDPSRFIKAWQNNGTKVIPVVASVALAKRMARLGVDAIIAEGGEAGGHVGELNTMTLVPAVVDAIDLPVIAAGGIFDARGVLASFALGAAGVQVGTRFILAEECTVHENYKKKVMKAKDIDSFVTGRNTGHPVRVLRNPLSKELKKMDQAGKNAEEIEAFSAGSLYRAAIEGDLKTGSFMAGQCACMVNEIEPAAKILESLLALSEPFARLKKQVEAL